MKAFRFINEYGNYIIDRLERADIPSPQKSMYIGNVYNFVKSAYTGKVTVAECMKMLNDLEVWLNGYNNSTNFSF